MDWTWLAPAVAVIAALAAVWQAAEARRANAGAREHERSALDAQQRVAAALERQTALAEAAATPADPWRFEALSGPEVDQLWSATNLTGEDATDVDITTPDGADEVWIQPIASGATDVEVGGEYRFQFIRRYTSPTSKMVTIRWTAGDGETRRSFTHRVS